MFVGRQLLSLLLMVELRLRVFGDSFPGNERIPTTLMMPRVHFWTLFGRTGSKYKHQVGLSKKMAIFEIKIMLLEFQVSVLRPKYTPKLY